MYTRRMQESNSLPAPHLSARQRALTYLREAILDGRLAGGEFVEEERISLAVGVSRTPVREAFQQLHGEGLIELLPRRGARVRVVTAAELVEIYQARLALESFAIAALCRHRLPPPAAMRTTMIALEHTGAAEARLHVRLNAAFHRALVNAAGNSVIAGLYASLGARQDLVAMTSVSIDPDRIALINHEHRALVEAIEAHDASRAIAVLQTHLSPVGEIMARLPAGSVSLPKSA